MTEARVRERLAAAGWEWRRSGTMERVWPDGTFWRCTYGTTRAGRCEGDIPKGLIFATGDEVFVVDVLGFTDPAGMGFEGVDRTAAGLDLLAAASPGGTLAKNVLKPLMARAAVFRERSVRPIGLSGFMLEEMPRRPAGPLIPAIAAADGSSDRWLDVAFAALDARMLHVALESFDRALAAGAEPGLAELWRGWLLMEADPVEAATALERAADGGMAGPATCLLAGIRPVDWERATREDPGYLLGWLSRVLELGESGRAREALRVIDEAAALHPGAKVHHYRGWVHALLGDEDAALDDLAEAVRLAPWITEEILADPDHDGLRGHLDFWRLTDRRAADNEQNPQATEVLRRLAVQTAARAPDGWRRATFTIGGGTRGYYTLPDGALKNHGLPFDLRKALRLGRGTAVTMVVHPSGWFEAAVGGRAENSGVACVLDEEALPSGPGDEVDGPADPTQAGDPAEAVRLLRAYLQRREEILGYSDELPPPAADREEMFADLDHALPDDLRALYDVMDGDDDLGLIDNGYDWLSASFVSELGSDHVWVDNVPLFDPDPWRIMLDDGPPGAVRRSIDRDGWIPFADGGNNEYLAVDMDPGPGGRPGQVIRIGLRRDGPTYVADSVTSLLRRHVEALERGDWTCEDDDLRIDLGDMALARENENAPDASTVWACREVLNPGHNTQSLWVRGGGDIDLGTVRGTRLLKLELTQCRSADLSPLRDTAVEALTLQDVEALDLAPIAGHPTLRAVRVRAHHAVDLEPLVTAPRLYALDLCGSSVMDLAALGRMSRLRYLSLRYEQWQELWRQNVTLPGLAMAVLSDDPSPSRIAEWARRLPRGGGVQHYIGQY
ncbi:SMI1/KNR4 family protein [Nonomuraea jabiensis]|uniref:Cell wall assembly regulator SMI1 n=1 Tax=Nonomuraea jabiensis TaxID=882448 RepID=A0A7W9LFH9_9ACTN|nr:SMI1/KNR4 family protein [Nonomuraea jabiensis]MBB5781871.1 cell wall assembly regulator SMI1 [Nonomuraea jabiensis]